jgi:hypothetical protein
MSHVFIGNVPIQLYICINSDNVNCVRLGPKLWCTKYIWPVMFWKLSMFIAHYIVYILNNNLTMVKHITMKHYLNRLFSTMHQCCCLYDMGG